MIVLNVGCSVVPCCHISMNDDPLWGEGRGEGGGRERGRGEEGEREGGGREGRGEGREGRESK